MKVIIFGGSGFIGQAIDKYLQAQGLNVVIASRGKTHAGHNSGSENVLTYTLDTVQELLRTVSEDFTTDYVIINLAGESINSGRWTKIRKERILSSRVQITRAISAAILQCKRKPAVLINASAIGFYGDSETKSFTEEDAPGHGFLAEVTRAWEQEAYTVKQQTRVVVARIGMVLGKHGGALPRMLLPYRWFAGGKIGSGKQWISWIHIEDVAKTFYHCIMHSQLVGPVNVTSPHPVTMDEFGRTLAKVLHRPHWLEVPEYVLRCILGEMAELVIKGQNVLPKTLLNSGYSFQFSTLDTALKDLLGNT